METSQNTQPGLGLADMDHTLESNATFFKACQNNDLDIRSYKTDGLVEWPQAHDGT